MLLCRVLRCAPEDVRDELNDRQGDVQLDAASGSFAGLTLDLTDFTDAQADAAVGRITTATSG